MILLPRALPSYAPPSSRGLRRVRARAFMLAVVVVLSIVFTVLYVHFWTLRLRNLEANSNDNHAFLVGADIANIWIARLIVRYIILSSFFRSIMHTVLYK